MKKLFLILILAAIITGAAFAEHPKGLGIGGMWSGEFYPGNIMGAALSLKLPSVPIFWGIHAHGWDSGLYLAVSGDKYLIDQTFIKEAGLGWYLGLGGYVGLTFASPPSAHLGARLPIGLSWMPVKFFELFLGLTPSLGINLNPFYFPTWGVPLEIGLRIWI
jgi:hypothetical protein